MSDNPRNKRRVMLSTTRSGVGKGNKSQKQKDLEKQQKKIKRNIIKGKGLATGGFRHGRNRTDYRSNQASVKESAQASTNTIKAKNDAQVQQAINKMKNKSRTIAIKRTPATLGNKTVVASKKE